MSSGQLLPFSGVDKDGNTQDFIVNLQPLAEGGEGKIFLTNDKRYILKIYHPKIVRKWDSMREILKAAPGLTDPVHDLLAWPTHIVRRQNGEVGGVVVPNAALNDWMEQVIWYTSPRLWQTRSEDRRGSFKGFVKVALDIASALRYLNFKGYGHADLSGRNVLCNPSKGQAVVIDLDGLVVPNYMEGDVLGTPGYIAPELVDGMLTGNRVYPSAISDRHALAVLLFQLLLWRHPLTDGQRKPLHSDANIDDLLRTGTEFAIYVHHPTDKSNPPIDPYIPVEALGDEMAGLFQRAFVEGIKNPTARPHPAEWETALRHLETDLIECRNSDCPWGYFPAASGHAHKCPICNTKAKDLPAMGKLLIVPGHNGFYSKSRSRSPIALYREQTITRSNIFGSSISRSQTGLLQFKHQSGEWRMELQKGNDDVKAWSLDAVSGQRSSISSGRACTMSPSTIVILESANETCMIHVEM